MFFNSLVVEEYYTGNHSIFNTYTFFGFVNYIDDVSNIDTCKLAALLSTAQTLHVPYKDKKSLETLKTFVKTEDILQLAVWAMSLNVRNTKHVIDRLDLISEDISPYHKSK